MFIEIKLIKLLFQEIHTNSIILAPLTQSTTIISPQYKARQYIKPTMLFIYIYIENIKNENFGLMNEE